MAAQSAWRWLLGGALAILTAISTAGAADDANIAVGISAPLQIQAGRDTVDGAQMAIDEINANGGVLGRKLHLVSADEGADVQSGIAAMRKLTADDKVDVVVGSGNSGVVLAQLPVIADAKTIYLGTSAASPAITNFYAKDHDRFKYFFRTSPLSAGRQGASYVDLGVNMLKNEMGFQKIALVGENSRFIQDVIPPLKAGLEKGGVTVTTVELFDTATSDFSPVFSRVKDSGAQFMMIFLSESNSDVFVKQWHDIKFPMPIGGIDVKSQDSDFFKRIDGKAVSEIVVIQFAPVPLSPKTMPFWNAFSARYKRQPVYTGAGAYDATYLYAEAVERAKSVDTDKIIAELEKTKHAGVQGTIAFDDRHDVKDGPGGINSVFVQWQPDGSRTIVWPASIANGKAILPPWIDGGKR